MALNLVTAPPATPVSNAEVWEHLRVTLSGAGDEPVDRAHIEALITAATAYLDGRDGVLGRALVPQTWDYTLDRFPCEDSIRLPLPPVQSIASLKYIDTSGVLQTWSSSNYALSADKTYRPRVDLAYGQVWPDTRRQRDAVTIRIVCGYASGDSPETAAGVPNAIKAAMLLLIGHWYEHREDVVMGVTPAMLPMGVDALLAPYRILG